MTVYNFLALSPISLFFGAGTVSTQFDGGFNNIFGYLYPADIGIIGGVFLYGIFVVIFRNQAIFWMWVAPKRRKPMGGTEMIEWPLTYTREYMLHWWLKMPPYQLQNSDNSFCLSHVVYKSQWMCEKVHICSVDCLCCNNVYWWITGISKSTISS